MSRIVTILIVLLLAPMLVATGDRAASAQSGGDPACEMLGLINDLRQDNGVAPLELSQPLNNAAGTKATDMAEGDYFAHTSPDGVDFQELLANAGYTYNTSIGENIAAGHEDAGATFEQWANSAPHLAIMLDADYTALGVGSAYNADSEYDWYWAAEFGGVVGTPGPSCGDTDPEPGGDLIATLIAILTEILAGV